MSANPSNQVTLLLEAAAKGDARATDELLPVVYEEMRRLASSLLSRERAANTLQPTALVHEAYLRLVGPGDVSWQNRAHFFGAAARSMRRILIDRARHIRSTRVERGAASVDDCAVAEPATDGMPTTAEDLIVLDEAMDSLKERDERQHEVVMLRYFAGLTIDQTALAMELSAGTIKNEWVYARAWLLREIERRRKDESGGGAGGMGVGGR